MLKKGDMVKFLPQIPVIRFDDGLTKTIYTSSL